MRFLQRYLPILGWSRRYTRDQFTDDGVAAVIVTIMLIPQSLAYALLAGLPAEAGLYASIFALLFYGFFGTSSTLSVGPVAVISLMTAAALEGIAEPGTAAYSSAALTLALLSGISLVLMGVLRLGFAANFLSHPVIAAFITASGIIIAAGQVQHLLGIRADGHNLVEIAEGLLTHIGGTNPATLLVGGLALGMIIWMRAGLKGLLLRVGLSNRLAGVLAKGGPVVAVIITALLAWLLRLDERGVALVGNIPRGLPGLTLPDLNPDLLSTLAGPAALIAIIGFVESISVGQTLGAKRREQVRPDQELVGLGMANVSVAFGGGFPVTGGFSRSVVNFDAGAATPAAGIFTALLIGVATLLFTPLIYWLPKATLAATIIVAVTALIDFSLFAKAWRYSRSDFAAMAITVAVTLVIGVETGIAAGVLVSILTTLYNSSRPHVAVVGRVAGTEHFRNIKRHKVQTFDNQLSIRIDESLYFANSRYLEDLIYQLVTENSHVEHVILMCTAVNKIDMSALETLEQINATLKDLKIRLHLSEVKGPVMDRLRRTDFFNHLSGECFLTQNQAVEALKNEHMPLSGL